MLASQASEPYHVFQAALWPLLFPQCSVTPPPLLAAAVLCVLYVCRDRKKIGGFEIKHQPRNALAVALALLSIFYQEGTSCPGFPLMRYTLPLSLFVWGPPKP